MIVVKTFPIIGGDDMNWKLAMILILYWTTMWYFINQVEKPDTDVFILQVAYWFGVGMAALVWPIILITAMVEILLSGER